jgi:protein MpaA
MIALHAHYRMVNWDGTAEPLARELSERCGYPVEHDMGYPTPGSFGTKYGVEQHHEVITLETPYLMPDEAAWIECRTALRWCVDLPD